MVEIEQEPDDNDAILVAAKYISSKNSTPQKWNTYLVSKIPRVI